MLVLRALQAGASLNRLRVEGTANGVRNREYIWHANVKGDRCFAPSNTVTPLEMQRPLEISPQGPTEILCGSAV